MNKTPKIHALPHLAPKLRAPRVTRNGLTNELLIPIGGKCFDAQSGEKFSCVPGAICTTELPDFNSICVKFAKK